MVFAGLGSVRIVKNCDRGLSNPRSQFFAIQIDPKPADYMLIFFPAFNWFYRLQMGFFTASTNDC